MDSMVWVYRCRQSPGHAWGPGQRTTKGGHTDVDQLNTSNGLGCKMFIKTVTQFKLIYRYASFIHSKDLFYGWIVLFILLVTGHFYKIMHLFQHVVAVRCTVQRFMAKFAKSEKPVLHRKPSSLIKEIVDFKRAIFKFKNCWWILV
jgi:hypothetical protein